MIIIQHLLPEMGHVAFLLKTFNDGRRYVKIIRIYLSDLLKFGLKDNIYYTFVF